MEDEPERVPPLTAAQEAERRGSLLEERHRIRDRRRWITGVAVVVATVLVGAGAVTAWNSQGHAEFVAGRIEQWRDERDAAECALSARVLVAVRAEERARGLLADARSIPLAVGVYGEDERAAFGDDGIPLLQAMAEGTILDDMDRARVAGDGAAFDVDSCTATARRARPALAPAIAENADELAREWRALGRADDVDDVRVATFEAAVAQLGQLAEGTAASRVEVEALRADREAAPAEAFDRFAPIDAAIAALVDRDGIDAPGVFDLIAVLADRVSAAREVETIAVAAAAEDAAAAAAAAAAAQAAAEAAAASERAEAPAVVSPEPGRPGPVQPPPVEQPAPTNPAPPAPSSPAPTIPAPPEVTEPSEPEPIIPPEQTPEPTTDPSPERRRDHGA